MQCLVCHASAPEGSRFCPSCGRPLVDSDAVTRLTAQPASIAHDVTRLPTGAVEVTQLPTEALDVTSLPTQSLDEAARSGTRPRTGGTRLLDAPIEEGSLLGDRYRVTRLLGRGGMGAVYLADDLRLNQPVALKLLPPALARDPKRLAQFHNEVSLARQISHPNVCRVYDISEIDGRLFLSMEYIDGEDLAAALRRRGAFPAHEAVELTRQICAGLAAVHTRGVLHRDLKPANIMLNKAGQPQLMDFGIATAGAADGAREGTPTYMAPEHLLGEQVSERSDIYALGLMMHEIFTGQRVFATNTPLETLVAQHTSKTTTPPLDSSRLANALVRDVITQCLDRDPARRPASAQTVASLLKVEILNETTLWRRIVQNVLISLTSLVLPGLMLVTRSRGRNVGVGLTLVAVSAVGCIAALRFHVGWNTTYKGHRIRFDVHPLKGERLFIDERLVDRGRIGFSVMTRGTIESGEGAGERITAESTCTFVRISCRIVAEAFQ
ncbi:MAG TPA: serine/threonine-protein kinase [Vicinamibacterales bacterium]|jgi:predicted Ser/Thr protein kinase